MAVPSSSFYAEHIKVYPQRILGRFRVLKWAALGVLLSVYYLAPWLRWDRGPGAPDQALLVDMTGRRAYFFWVEIWPQEVYYLAGLLILGAIGLFLATSLLGRVWCGFTCPQTVWTDLYMQVERWIEGDRNARIKLDAEPWGIRKLSKKIAKHAIWVLIAVLTGGAWVMYFDDAPTLVKSLATFQASSAQYGFIGLFAGTTYLLAGWAREQVCIYMCPWPRFQAAMFDEHSLLVTYEAWRGEPRGHMTKNQIFEIDDRRLRGDCIDCGLCVRVCPTGIDIRDGQQLACIGCALCVDACNSVMTKIGRPPELITYDSLSNQAERAAGRQARRRLIRPRTVIYAATLVLAVAGMFTALTLRGSVEVTVQGDRSPLFVKLADGEIQNGYTLKISNKQRTDASFFLNVTGIDGLQTKIIGGVPDRLTVKPDRIGTYRMLLHAPRDALKYNTNAITIIVVNAITGEESRHAAIFNAPGK
jgi:cytochrome c oxidase accessory protein FixG